MRLIRSLGPSPAEGLSTANLSKARYGPQAGRVRGHGAGDAIAALFLAHYLRSRSAAEALSLSASSVFGVLKRTAEVGAQEMLLIEAQDELVKPSTMFRTEPL